MQYRPKSQELLRDYRLPPPEISAASFNAFNQLMRALRNHTKTSFSREFLSAETDKRIKLEREAGSDGMGQLMKLSSFSLLASPWQFKNRCHPVEIAAIKLVTPQLRRREEGRGVRALFFSVYLTTLPAAHTNRFNVGTGGAAGWPVCRKVTHRPASPHLGWRLPNGHNKTRVMIYPMKKAATAAALEPDDAKCPSFITPSPLAAGLRNTKRCIRTPPGGSPRDMTIVPTELSFFQPDEVNLCACIHPRVHRSGALPPSHYSLHAKHLNSVPYFTMTICQFC